MLDFTGDAIKMFQLLKHWTVHILHIHTSQDYKKMNMLKDRFLGSFVKAIESILCSECLLLKMGVVCFLGCVPCLGNMMWVDEVGVGIYKSLHLGIDILQVTEE